MPSIVDDFLEGIENIVKVCGKCGASSAVCTSQYFFSEADFEAERGRAVKCPSLDFVLYRRVFFWLVVFSLHFRGTFTVAGK